MALEDVREQLEKDNTVVEMEEENELVISSDIGSEIMDELEELKDMIIDLHTFFNNLDIS